MTDEELQQLSGQMAAIDVDPARAAEIARRARTPRRRRWVEPVVVTVLTASFLVWALWKTFGW
jgi:hypothetical protein